MSRGLEVVLFLTSEIDEKFGFNSGSDFTLEEFQRYADEFKEMYFRRDCDEDFDTWEKLLGWHVLTWEIC